MRRYLQYLAHKMPIPVLCNLFMLWNRWYGISGTVTRIQQLSIPSPTTYALASTDIDKVSRRINGWCRYTPFLLYSSRQRCLVRGYVLYYWAKCRGIPLELVVGAAPGEGEGTLDWHCWLEQEDRVLYEVPDIITQYHEFVRYT